MYSSLLRIFYLFILKFLIILSSTGYVISDQDGLSQFGQRDLDEKVLFKSHHLIADNLTNNQSKLAEKRKIQNILTDDDDDDDDDGKAYETNGWSNWSLWSNCSRSCGGGISYSYRYCSKQGYCSKGESTRYRICNMQPCPYKVDFRALQCSFYNNNAYHGRYYHWLPYLDPQNPCSLTCIAEEYKFVVTHASKIEDGTLCKEGSLDMCVSGICLPVGCDLQLGSSKKINECGVCDDPDKPCNKSIYVWSQTQFTDCSVSCGGGFQNSKVICIKKDTKEEVDEKMCDEFTRPQSFVKSCNIFSCPLRWVTEKWSHCTAICGGGYQTRKVYCVKDTLNGKHIRIADHECSKPIPITQRTCNNHDCLQWFQSPWSECSNFCGNGTQTRRVLCRNSSGLVVDGCDISTKPSEIQNCYNGPCLTALALETNQEDEPSYDDMDFFKKFHSSNSLISLEPEYKTGEWSECNVTCGKGFQTRKVQCEIFLEFSKTSAPVSDHECQDEKPIDIMECILPPCKNVNLVDKSFLNKSFLDIAFHRSNKLPESAALALFSKVSSVNKIEKVTYSWKNFGYTLCSADCLGGTQESIIQCVRSNDSAVVAHFFCNLFEKPDSITKTCNDHSCPPRWNVTEFGKCSENCGGGYQTRKIECIHEVTRGLENVLVVPNEHCPQPKPEQNRRCNEHACPAKWIVEKWGKCSQSCGGGLKIRKIKCVKVNKAGQQSEVSSVFCPKNKPLLTKRCNVRPCYESKSISTLLDVKPSSIHRYVQQTPSQRVSIKIGGEAFVFKGTTLKIRCPQKRSSNNRISFNPEWYKDGVRIKFERRYQLTSRGALKIKNINHQDEGVFMCSFGKTKTNISVFVKPVSNSDSTIKKFWNEKSEEKTLSQKLNKIKWNKNNEINEMDKIEGNSIDSLQSKNSFKDFWEENKESNKPGFISDQQANENEDFYSKKKSSFDHTFLSNDQNVARSSASSNHDFMGRMKNFLKQKWTSETYTKNLIPKKKKIEKFGSTYYLDDYEEDSFLDRFQSLSEIEKLSEESFTNLEYDWMISDWSTCSQRCGGKGFQVRASECLIKVNNISKAVEKNFCIRNGLDPPVTIRNCGLRECPKWIMGSWSECSNCIDIELGTHSREIQCVLSNLTQLSDDNCNQDTKPISNKTCVNKMCKPIWIADQWSNCQGECGQEGFQTLNFKCVWYGSESLAENKCKKSEKPFSTRTCLVNCESECTDENYLCRYSKVLKACHLLGYRKLCCKTCNSL